MDFASLRIYDASEECNALPIGLAKLTRLAFAGINLDRIAEQLLGIFERNPSHAGALMDLSVIDQLNGKFEIGLTRQAVALSKQRIFHSTCCGARPRLRMLAFVAAADIGANTPLEFLLEGSDIALTMAYVLPERPLPADLPEHDLAFVAVAASETNRVILDELDEMLAWWPVPVINLPSRIPVLARDKLFSTLHSVPGLQTPPFMRVRRDDLQAAAVNAERLSEFAPGCGFPIIVGPLDSLAGDGHAKIDDDIGLSQYLAGRGDDFFLISPFINYQSSDGQFRKFRVVLIDQRPYACHMAISDQWNMHYFDAKMEMSAAKRMEEASFFGNFDRDFAVRHRAALTALAERIGLTYFGVDCAEMSSGDLLIFEADHTLLVHDMDPVDVFPYKPAQMRKIFDAFASLLYKTANAAGAGRRPRGHRS
ncbi:MAG: hypothetical protein HYS06_02830 [Methylocystis sp.]|nr:hypothetical protein [Methylocystis sp.]